MANQILLLIVGFIILIKGANAFIDGSTSIAIHLKAPKLLIGLTIIAFGTSAPELAISLNSFAQGSTDIVFGNVIGSNIINITLILGISALIAPIKVKNDVIKKELPMGILITTLLLVLLLDNKISGGDINQITRSDGIAIFLFFGVFIYYLLNLSKVKKENIEYPKYTRIQSIVYILIGLVGLILGSRFVVSSSIYLAHEIGISERIIGLTIVAFGTSLPELVTAIVACIKKETDLLLGNIIGSNIFNICIVLGIPVILFGNVTYQSFRAIELITFVLSSIILYILSRNDRKITRIDGIILLSIFIAYYTLVFIR